MIDQNLFYELETELLKPEVRSSVEKLHTLLADDFTEFGSAGDIYDKEAMLEVLPANAKAEKFNIENFSVKELSDSVVLITYEINETPGEKQNVSLRSSVWRKKDEVWQIVFHQATPLK